MILLLTRAQVWMTSFCRITIGKYIQSILGAHTLPIENWPKGEIDFSNVDKTEGFRKTHIFSFLTNVLTTPLSHPVNKPKRVGDKKVWPTIKELLGIGKTDRILLKITTCPMRCLYRELRGYFLLYENGEVFLITTNLKPVN